MLTRPRVDSPSETSAPRSKARAMIAWRRRAARRFQKRAMILSMVFFMVAVFYAGRMNPLRSENLRGLFQREIRDEKFSEAFAGLSLSGIVELNPSENVVLEQLPYFGNVVERQDELAAHVSQSFFKLDKVFLLEIEAVELPAPVRRVEIKEGARPVIPRENFLIREGFDLDLLKALVCFFNERRETARIEVRRSGDAVMVVAVQDETTERIFLEVEEPCRALNVRKALRVLFFEQTEPLPANQNILQVTQELFVVRLADSEKVRNLTVKIIQDFH